MTHPVVRFYWRVRDAINGRFVKREEAYRRPNTTVTEKVERKEPDEKK